MSRAGLQEEEEQRGAFSLKEGYPSPPDKADVNRELGRLRTKGRSHGKPQWALLCQKSLVPHEDWGAQSQSGHSPPEALGLQVMLDILGPRPGPWRPHNLSLSLLPPGGQALPI